ncbi:MAG: BREX-1 system adenine-specific DNA-methyltransferase PglX [Clostridium sp.]
MDKNKIRFFATWARKALIEGVKYRAYSLGIEKDYIRNIEEVQGGFRVEGRPEVFKVSTKHREDLIKEIEKKGFDNVIDEVAYTWFNRLIALRYMEVNDYLPSGIRVLSSELKGKVDPDIISRVGEVVEALKLDPEYIYALVDIGNNSAREQLYRYLLVKQCNELGNIIPWLFEKIEDYTELLLPNNLLGESYVIRKLCLDIEDESWKDEVEILGWMYQYYISEEKDRVFEGLKKNVKITKENIPAATQLFTPKWIVKYLVDNSIGSLWMQGHGRSNLDKELEYYVGQGSQNWKAQEVIYKIKVKRSELSPEGIKVLDPCMGSGHILVYAFEVLYKIYLSAGYSEREIPRKILENNIFGLDIDGRAVQLGAFALIMKARQFNRRLLRDIERTPLKLNVASVEESNGITLEGMEYFAGDNDALRGDLSYLVSKFQDAKEYGSILEVKDINFYGLEKRLKELNQSNSIIFAEYLTALNDKLPKLINQGRIMSKKYEIVITNPPYMGLRGANDTLAKYLSDKFPVSKHDMFSVFMEVCNRYLMEDGIYAMVNQHSWMFLSSFLELRNRLLNESCFINMVHLGAKAFEENVGTIVQNVAFVNQKSIIPEYVTRIVDVTKEGSTLEKAKKVIDVSRCAEASALYETDLKKLMAIPSRPFAYWVNDNILKIFSTMDRLEAMAKPRQGMATSDNKRFLRDWYEVDINKVNFCAKDSEEAVQSKGKWFPYNKGGEFRKWFGNNRYLINWENNGAEVKEYAAKLYKSYSRTIKNEEFYFKSGLTYTFISEDMGVRYSPDGFIFDVAGSSIFFYDKGIEKLMLAFLCSKVSNMFMDMMNPTFNIQVGDLKNIPLSPGIFEDKVIEEVDLLVEENIKISEEEWDSFETSWNFKAHPFIKGLKPGNNALIENQFAVWAKEREKAIKIVKANEEKLNELFIEIYGLTKELEPRINEKDVTLRKADLKEDIKTFISYAVGCIFGRYSVDREGIAFAGGDINSKWDFDNGRINIDGAWGKASFIPKKDNILIITEGEYLEGDLVSLFIDFVGSVFGMETLEGNLSFIASALTMKENETSREAIRRYLIKDFYKDHLKSYAKKPIYWLLDSGKNDGIKSLIYIHRYDEETIARFRIEYLLELQKLYEKEINRLAVISNSDNYSAKERAKAKKQRDKFKKQLNELEEYDAVVAHFADEHVPLNLDEGIKVNYEKFQGIKVTTNKGKEVKMNLLGKI